MAPGADTPGRCSSLLSSSWPLWPQALESLTSLWTGWPPKIIICGCTSLGSSMQICPHRESTCKHRRQDRLRLRLSVMELFRRHTWRRPKTRRPAARRRESTGHRTRGEATKKPPRKAPDVHGKEVHRGAMHGTGLPVPYIRPQELENTNQYWRPRQWLQALRSTTTSQIRDALRPKECRMSPPSMLTRSS